MRRVFLRWCGASWPREAKRTWSRMDILSCDMPTSQFYNEMAKILSNCRRLNVVVFLEESSATLD